MDAFKEATINAFLHNDWTTGNEPMFTAYSNRIEIPSRGFYSPEPDVFYLRTPTSFPNGIESMAPGRETVIELARPARLRESSAFMPLSRDEMK